MTTDNVLRMTHHCEAQAAAKGFTPEQVFAAAADADIRYASRNHPGQERRIRDGLCVVVDAATNTIVTLYVHCTETALRPDQKGAVIAR